MGEEKSIGIKLLITGGAGFIGSNLVEHFLNVERHEKPRTFEGSNAHVYDQYTIRVDEGKRDGIAAAMKESGIPVGIYYPKCFHEQPVFEHLGYTYGDFPESEKASREVLSLPMHPFLSIDEQEQIISQLIDLL